MRRQRSPSPIIDNTINRQQPEIESGSSSAAQTSTAASSRGTTVHHQKTVKNNNIITLVKSTTTPTSSSLSSSSSTTPCNPLHPVCEMTETFSNARFLAEGGYGRVVSAVDLHQNQAHQSAKHNNNSNNVAIKVMDFELSTEDAKRLESLSQFGDLANLLPGQDYIPSHVAAELRAHDALRDVKGTMPLLRVETFSDYSTLKIQKHAIYGFEEEIIQCYVMLVLPLLTPLHTRFFSPTKKNNKTNNTSSTATARLVQTSKDLARALSEMHARGWLHRDLSVTNVFVTTNNTNNNDNKQEEQHLQQQNQVFIGDFGLAVSPHGRTGSASKFFAPETNACTTIWYRSPEVVQNPELPYTCSNDCWSLGSVISELIFSRPLFPGMNRDDQLMEMKSSLGLNGQNAASFFSSLLSDLLTEEVQQQQLFDAVCKHLLNFDPSKRSVQKFLEALE